MKPHIKRHRTGYWMIYVNRSALVPLISDKCLQSAWEAYEHWFKVTHTRNMPPSKMSPCYLTFKSELCGYSGSAISCNKSFQRCKQLKNHVRFGGWIRQ